MARTHLAVIIACALSCAVGSAIDLYVKGDPILWDSLFCGARALEVVSTGYEWTDGPVWVKDALYFSDTVTAKMYKFTPGHHGASAVVETVLTCSGGVCPDDAEHAWRAEPGANGLAMAGSSGRKLLVARHGVPGVVMMDITTSPPEVTDVIATRPGLSMKKLNGPNDLAVDWPNQIVYFTDSVNAFQSKAAFKDAPHLDAAVAERGAGFKGVFAARLPRHKLYRQVEPDTEMVEPLVEWLARPSGLALLPPESASHTRLAVANCCQGANETCAQGTAQWHVFDFERTATDTDLHAHKHTHLVETFDEATQQAMYNHHPKFQTIEYKVLRGDAGCAGGFALAPKNLNVRTQDGHPHPPKELLVATCARGLCLVDVKMGKVRASVVASKAPIVTSNVAFGGDGYVYITGKGNVWRLPYGASCPNYNAPDL
jgi:sugar lactone lactonase YvrE